MDINDLKYIVEVNRASSISKAASNLFISQPNLSKAIANIEHELGIIIFKRTPQGVLTTPDGKKFISYAQTIISQFDEFESMFKPEKNHIIKFGISMPRATYISVALANFLSKIDSKTELNINIKETNSLATINNVASGDCEIGIIRYSNIHEDYFMNVLKQNNLSYEVLCEYRQKILVSKSHPLANRDEVYYHELMDYTEITHGDLQVPNIPYNKINSNATGSKRRIYVYERGSQFELLKRLKTSYMLVSPIPDDVLESNGLILLNCPLLEKNNKDVLIYSSRHQINDYEKSFISEIKKNFEKIKVRD